MKYHGMYTTGSTVQNLHLMRTNIAGTVSWYCIGYKIVLFFKFSYCSRLQWGVKARARIKVRLKISRGFGLDSSPFEKAVSLRYLSISRLEPTSFAIKY